MVVFASIQIANNPSHPGAHAHMNRITLLKRPGLLKQQGK
jgi:hypothetical protein